MQVAGKEVRRYTVSPEETGLSYPLQVIVYQPRNGETLKASVVSFELAEAYSISDEAVTWEDATWQ
ncbi:MAG: hypothetical protein E6R14_11180 [Thermomicrobiales bacterium]|nr:MAG: hypothetical protein E6R14_11180 [Thermomicrobiales bacterium]